MLKLTTVMGLSLRSIDNNGGDSLTIGDCRETLKLLTMDSKRWTLITANQTTLQGFFYLVSESTSKGVEMFVAQGRHSENALI